MIQSIEQMIWIRSVEQSTIIYASCIKDKSNRMQIENITGQILFTDMLFRQFAVFIESWNSLK